jgi:hypothetical protein
MKICTCCGEEFAPETEFDVICDTCLGVDQLEECGTDDAD